MEELLLTLIKSFDAYLHSPFWQRYDFWLGVINIVVLFVTLLFLIKYTKETEQTRKQIARQTELEQMPIMLMYIRNVSDYTNSYGELQKIRDKYQKYLIRIRIEESSSDYFINLRNTGKGTAFNVTVESDKFDIIDYKTQFFAPQKDEHPIVVIQKGDKKIENWEMFYNSTFKIKCKDVVGNNYQFEYKIIDIKNRKIEYLGSRLVN